MNRNAMKSMTAMFAPAFEIEGGGGSPGVTLEAPPPSPSSEPADQQPSQTPAPGAPGGTQPAPTPRTFTSDEVSNTVRERLAQEQKRWEGFGDPKDLRARLDRAERLEKALKGDDPNQQSPEDKEFRSYLERQYPGIKNLEQLEQMAQGASQRLFQQQVQSSEQEVGRLAKDAFGLEDPAHVEIVNDLVAKSIAGDPEALAAWRNGDTSVVGKHFEKVAKDRLDPLLRTASARYAAAKTKNGNELPPRMPPGGAPAPASKDGPMPRDARIKGAFEKFKAG